MALISAALLAGVIPAAAEDATSLIGQCFARTYDAAHLREHAGQDVTTISALFLEYEGEPAVQLRFTTRDGAPFFINGTCNLATDATIACEVCLRDGCEPTGETFRLVRRGGDLLFYNDATGVTAAAIGAASIRRLDPGGEHRVFLLRPAAAEACAS